jgi:hypothetical protein
VVSLVHERAENGVVDILLLGGDRKYGGGKFLVVFLEKDSNLG